MTKKTLPLHQVIRQDVESQILSGKLAPGARVPVEHELMAAYGCSRMTVNKALTSLVESGLITRNKRAGTFVSAPGAPTLVLDIPDIQSDIQAGNEDYRFDLIFRGLFDPKTARPEIRELVRDLAQAGPVLEIKGVHLANGRPRCSEYRLINLMAVPDATYVDFSLVSPGAWLLDQVPWTEAEHRITALAADKETARNLDLAPGAPCLVVERKTWRGADRITTVRQSFPGETYSLVSRFGYRPNS